MTAGSPGVKISVIVPTKDEAAAVRDVLRGAKAHGEELIVIDGHSKDATRRIAGEEGARVILDRGRGKGEALRTAAAAARGEILLFIDADGSQDPEDIPRLLAPILGGEADLVVGSRLRGGSDEYHGSLEEAARLVGSAVITQVVNHYYNVRLSDCQNGFRAIRREVFLSLGLKANLTTVEQEMVMRCLKKGYRVAEVPTHERRRRGGVSKINVARLAPHYVFNLLRYTLLSFIDD